MLKVKIYVLVNPLDNSVFYVGASKYPESRYSCHCAGMSWHYSTKRYRIIKELKKIGLKPELQILEECEIENARSREQYWINHYRGIGKALDQSPVSGYPTKPYTTYRRINSVI